MTYPAAGSHGSHPDQALDTADRAVGSDLLGRSVEYDREEQGALAGLGAEGEVVVGRQASLWGDAWRRLVRNRLAVIGMIIVTAFLAVALLAPVLAPYSESEPVDRRPEALRELVRYPPTWLWPFGLDRNGRDIFSRMVYGARVSLLVGVVSYIIILAIAIPIGSIAGYYG